MFFRHPFDMPMKDFSMSNFDLTDFTVRSGALPVPVILDTDTYNEIDDQFALIYCIAAPDKLKLRGVTAAPFYNDRSTGPADGMQKSFDEINRILKLTGKNQSIPARRGADRFQGDRHTPIASAATDLIIAEAKQAKADGRRLFVCAIAALTNVAGALLLAPEIAESLVVVWLGGHQLSETKNLREFNLQGDIPAAQTVFSCGVPVIQIPCNHVASQLYTTSAMLHQRLDDTLPISCYLLQIYDEYVTERQAVNKVIWDIAAVSYLTLPQAGSWELAPTPILLDDCRWQADPGGRTMKRATKLDRQLIFDDLFDRINRLG